MYNVCICGYNIAILTHLPLLAISESSAVMNISALAITASEILVQWDAPLYPNGAISHFNVCINGTNCSTAQANDTSHLLRNLASQRVYDITIQPVTIFEGVVLVGNISEPQRVRTNTTAPGVTGQGGYELITNGTVEVNLPSYTEFDGSLM